MTQKQRAQKLVMQRKRHWQEELKEPHKQQKQSCHPIKRFVSKSTKKTHQLRTHLISQKFTPAKDESSKLTDTPPEKEEEIEPITSSRQVLVDAPHESLCLHCDCVERAKRAHEEMTDQGSKADPIKAAQRLTEPKQAVRACETLEASLDLLVHLHCKETATQTVCKVRMRHVMQRNPTWVATWTDTTGKKPGLVENQTSNGQDQKHPTQSTFLNHFRCNPAAQKPLLVT